jgi:TonB family protein
MARDPNTPLILWICAAVSLHYMAGEGGGMMADFNADRSFIALMGARVRDRVRSTEQTFELALGTDKTPDEAEPPAPPPPPPAAKPEPKKEPAAPKPEEREKTAEEKKKPVPLLIKPEEKQKPPEIAPLMDDKRIAVRQHVKPNQEDNPNAHFIGDEANHVEQESVATQTSHDRDDENPTPGGNHAGEQGRAGDSDRTKIAESEDHRGEQNRAPGEKGTEFDIQKEPMPTKPQGPVAVQAPASLEPPRSGGDGRAPQQPKAAIEPQLAPGGAAPPSPEVAQGSDPGWSWSPIRPGAGAGSAAEPGEGSAVKPPTNPGSTQWLGLGGQPGPGQVNLNLSPKGVVAVVGQDQLRKEREADGERRRSEHRGSWQASNFERWRSAIENYVSSVKPGNQTALNTAAVPFASYLNGMHNRIHPIFADNFLGSLDGLPKNHPMNDQKLITRLEIVVTRDGHLVKMGVVKTSGITAFDIAALDSVNRAQPFGPAPGAVVSPDGNVYLHWEFHRDEVYACSTMNARPFLLNTPKKEPGEPNEPKMPGKPSAPQERGAPPPQNLHDLREGAIRPRGDGAAS